MKMLPVNIHFIIRKQNEDGKVNEMVCVNKIDRTEHYQSPIALKMKFSYMLPNDVNFHRI